MTVYYMHSVSGYVATEKEWEADYKSMDPELWFGKSSDEITDSDRDNWKGCGSLIEVVKSSEGDWVEA